MDGSIPVLIKGLNVRTVLYQEVDDIHSILLVTADRSTCDMQNTVSRGASVESLVGYAFVVMTYLRPTLLTSKIDNFPESKACSTSAALPFEILCRRETSVALLLDIPPRARQGCCTSSPLHDIGGKNLPIKGVRQRTRGYRT